MHSNPSIQHEIGQGRQQKTSFQELTLNDSRAFCRVFKHAYPGVSIHGESVYIYIYMHICIHMHGLFPDSSSGQEHHARLVNRVKSSQKLYLEYCLYLGKEVLNHMFWYLRLL